MPKEKSKPQQAMDEIQANVRPLLKELGFKARVRAFNRVTSGGITQVIEFQMGRFDPPGTHYVGFTQNMYGMFTVNVGVHVPELHDYSRFGPKLSFVREYDCWIRERLGVLGPERQDIWWKLDAVPQQSAEVFQRIERDALPFLERFATRERLLAEWMPDRAMKEETDFARFTRSRENLACGIILASLGRLEEAKACLRASLQWKPEHPSSSRTRDFMERLDAKN